MGIWCIVAVGLVAEDHLAQQHERPETWSYEQRLASDPPEARLHGILFLEQRGRVDKDTPRKRGVLLLQGTQYVLRMVLW